ncbi:Mor transcription activator family protein [Campylobacter sp. 9BO]|uniref:Mor transcription activator family protein n=1 Tax=Campylobacter sp. 9BO TaxID=3424759 RepID=UPI003D34585A
MISNFDLFTDFYEKIKQSESVAEVLKEFGGSSIYVPSYKSTFRNDDITNEYNALLKSGKPCTVAIREIAAKHSLSYNSIVGIIKESRQRKLNFED